MELEEFRKRKIREFKEAYEKEFKETISEGEAAIKFDGLSNLIRTMVDNVIDSVSEDKKPPYPEICGIIEK